MAIYIRQLLLWIKLRAQRIFDLGSRFEGVGALYRPIRLKSIGIWEILAHRLVCKWVYGWCIGDGRRLRPSQKHRRSYGNKPQPFYREDLI